MQVLFLIKLLYNHYKLKCCINISHKKNNSINSITYPYCIIKLYFSIDIYILYVYINFKQLRGKYEHNKKQVI